MFETQTGEEISSPWDVLERCPLVHSDFIDLFPSAHFTHWTPGSFTLQSLCNPCFLGRMREGFENWPDKLSAALTPPSKSNQPSWLVPQILGSYFPHCFLSQSVENMLVSCFPRSLTLLSSRSKSKSKVGLPNRKRNIFFKSQGVFLYLNLVIYFHVPWVRDTAPNLHQQSGKSPTEPSTHGKPFEGEWEFIKKKA